MRLLGSFGLTEVDQRSCAIFCFFQILPSHCQIATKTLPQVAWESSYSALSRLFLSRFTPSPSPASQQHKRSSRQQPRTVSRHAASTAQCCWKLSRCVCLQPRRSPIKPYTLHASVRQHFSPLYTQVPTLPATRPARLRRTE